MDRIVQSYIDDFLKSQQIDETDKCKQFEMFASYCAIAQQYTEVFDLNDTLTGAGGDCGIDAIAIIVNGTMITSCRQYGKNLTEQGIYISGSSRAMKKI